MFFFSHFFFLGFFDNTLHSLEPDEIEYRGGGHRTFEDSPTTIVTRIEANQESNAVKKRMKDLAFQKFTKYQNRKKMQLAQAERKKRLKMKAKNSAKYRDYLKKLDAKFHNRAVKQTNRKNIEIDNSYDGLMSGTVRGLIPGNTYQFRVRAVNNKGTGEFSPVSISTSTVSLPPKAMASVYTSHVAPFGCRISWQKPDCRGMSINEYCVFYSKIVNKKNYYEYMRNLKDSKIHSSRRNALTIDDIDDSMLDASQVKHIDLNQLRSSAIDLMPTIPSGMNVIALADMEGTLLQFFSFLLQNNFVADCCC